MRCHGLRFSVSAAISTAAVIFWLAPVTAGREPCACVSSPCEGDDEGASWIFEPSYYSHDPETGQRVTQYSPLPNVYAPEDPTYQESGFHYTQEILRGPNGSVDGYHLIQSWGRGDQIRPYGEWEYPYRAGATPYGPWGNPQGPWTLPFDSWQNPYGLGRLPNPPWPVSPYNQLPAPSPYGGNSYSPYNPAIPGTGYGPTPMLGPGAGPMQTPRGP